MDRNILEELLNTIESKAKNNMATITDVELFVSSWRKEALSICSSCEQLKDKNKTVIEELEQDLKDYHRKHDKGKINDLEYLRHTSFVKGKLSALYNL